MTEAIAMNRLMTEMKTMQRVAQSPLQSPMYGQENPVADADNKPSFTHMLKTAIDNVNDIQSQSNALKTAFEKGDPGVSLSQVMVTSQKSAIAFQSVLQVRNRLIDAYKEVMNMPV
jgi:flagellar hook-basal body complex protein FliE